MCIPSRLIVWTALLAIGLTAAHAEMIVRTKDGRTIRVPVEGSEIESITFASSNSGTAILRPESLPFGGGAPALPAGRQTYTGTFRNSRGEQGPTSMVIEEQNGKVVGDVDGDKFSGSRSGNVITFEYRNLGNGCRDYQYRVELGDNGKTANMTYTAQDRCRQPATYNGTAQMTRQ